LRYGIFILCFISLLSSLCSGAQTQMLRACLWASGSVTLNVYSTWKVTTGRDTLSRYSFPVAMKSFEEQCMIVKSGYYDHSKPLAPIRLYCSFFSLYFSLIQKAALVSTATTLLGGAGLVVVGVRDMCLAPLYHKTSAKRGLILIVAGGAAWGIGREMGGFLVDCVDGKSPRMTLRVNKKQRRRIMEIAEEASRPFN
jgi:hypothetical protein